jgi:uncharacterized protein YjbI with pentapeptide repeats
MDVTELIDLYAAGTRDFSSLMLIEANLSSINLSGCDLSNANLSVANLSGANLSGANLTKAKLNVARLSGANLTKAKLNGATLNVANLIRADFAGAELINTSLIRAELIRAELSKANMRAANLNGADLREATLRQANLTRANLSEANLRGASLTGAILEQSNLNGSDLSRSDLSGANLREAELRQTNLSKANLSGADLSGANLRWADLSGANLSWADLSDAKLSGANLVGADLSNANLLNTSLVHADLTQANLIRADWIGADLTGANLTGAKLFAVSRFGLKTDGMIADWVDLSPDGDRSEIQRFETDDPRKFFNQTMPKVKILVDAPLTLDANLLLLSAYQQLSSKKYLRLGEAPSIEVGARRTIITFNIDNNEYLFILGYIAILPFQDAGTAHSNIMAIVKGLQSQNVESLKIREPQRIRELIETVRRTIHEVAAHNLAISIPLAVQENNFFSSPTQLILTNSNDQSLSIFHHPGFGKKLLLQKGSSYLKNLSSQEINLPPLSTIVEFIQEFD